MQNGMKPLLACAVALIAWSNAGIVAAPPPIRPGVAAGMFVLELDGAQVGFVSAVEGGLAFGDVVKELGEEFFFKKHLGSTGQRNIRLEFGTGLDQSVYELIGLALQGQGPRLNGAILRADFNGNVRSRLEFTRALITEVTFPAADGASKDPARLSIVLSPEQTALDRSASGKVSVKVAKQKNVLASSFRLSIDGLDTKRVTKVDALTVKLPLSENDEGECSRCEGDRPPIDFPHVVVTLSETDADSIYEWFEEFVIAGNNDESQEKAGTLEFLTANLQTTVFTIRFYNLGIFALTPAELQAGSDSLPRLVAAMYCESMDFVAQ